MTAERIPVFRRRIRWAALFRWLHLYVSMLGFAALLFFAWTGITLNHPTWFYASEPTIREMSGQLGDLNLGENLDRLGIVEFLRDEHALRGRVDQFEPQETEISIVFKGPGYHADVLVDSATGRYSISEAAYGVTGILNDLHKGRDTGNAWSMLIDLSALIMITFSLTGFGLVFFLKKRRSRGVTVAVLGTIGIFTVGLWAFC